MQDISNKLEDFYKWKETTTGLQKVKVKDYLTSHLSPLLSEISSIAADSGSWGAKEKAFHFYLQGKALNVFDEYDKEAENNLSKAIKLDPSLIGAWNALGESYWKKGDLTSAKNCFSGALSQKNGNNKVSLRCLSMVLRQLGSDLAQKSANIEESVSKAKEAVALDVKDPLSWYILGNAHLTRFFGVNEDEGRLKQRSLPDLEAALRAYSQSELVNGVSTIADLHYNRAVLRTFKEDYASALEGYAKAAEMDPDWTLPMQMHNNIHQYVEQVQQAGALKGPLKAKRASILSSSLSTPSHSLPQITNSQIREGKNKGILIGKIGAILAPPGAAPTSIVIVDKSGGVGIVSLYGIDPQKGVQLGDTIGIPNPIAKHIEINVNNKKIEYMTIQTDYSMVEINGYSYNKDLYASPSLTISTDSTSISTSTSTSSSPTSSSSSSPPPSKSEPAKAKTKPRK